jgi:hypothetical protein
MRLLHFALSTLGYGEALIGLSLADQLKKTGVESHFVISGSLEKVLRRSGYDHTIVDESMGGLVRLVIDDVVERFCPDAIILSDYFTYSGVLDQCFGLDPWFVDEYDLPIIPIDIWEWETTDFSIDMCGGYSHVVSKRILDIDVHLRPVPLAHLNDGASGRGYPFRLWAEDERVNRRTRNHLLTTLGLRPADRLVMLTVAAWQQLAPENCRGDVARLSHTVPHLLASYLRKLPLSTHFLVVGKVPEALTRLPAERTRTIPPCSPKRFSTLLGSVDLVLSLNAGSTTLARAILSDIPGMVLTNRYTIEDIDSLDEAEQQLGGLSDNVRSWLAGAAPLYPFRMWPLGFHSFLEPILTDNPYTTTLAQAELLDEPGVISGLEAVLYNSDARDRLARARAAYRQKIFNHPDTCEVFAAAARRLGLAV